MHHKPLRSLDDALFTVSVPASAIAVTPSPKQLLADIIAYRVARTSIRNCLVGRGRRKPCPNTVALLGRPSNSILLAAKNSISGLTKHDPASHVSPMHHDPWTAAGCVRFASKLNPMPLYPSAYDGGMTRYLMLVIQS